MTVEGRDCSGGFSIKHFWSLISMKKRPRKVDYPSTSNVVDDVWSTKDGETAFQNGQMNSLNPKEKLPLRVAFRNQSSSPLMLSWLDPKGKCHHFYTLSPCPESLRDGPATSVDHIENTFLGDSFCIIYVNDKSKEEVLRHSKIVDPKNVIGGYRPRRLPKDIKKERNGKNKNVHLVTISQQIIPCPKKKMDCCFASPPFVGGKSGRRNALFTDDDECHRMTRSCWLVQAKESSIDENQIDTSQKFYTKSMLGGWPVFVEPNWHGGNTQLEQRMAMDLEWAAKRLPDHARNYLKESTPIWVNKSLCWGPEACPIEGRGLCYHPGSDFLDEHLMTKEKAYCVEMYNSLQYFEQDSKLWGKGGVFIHEFAHAYHHRCLEGGYDNKEVLDCFRKSVEEDQLYNWVRVHGTEGPMNKAYACTNAMEYFAELSAAFLGQPDLQSEEEFNKWYPFNRRHIKEHDPRAYQLLMKLWKISDCHD